MDTSIPPPAETGDPALWERVRAGDADAFALLFDRHHGRVHRHARRWSPGDQDAEDLVAAVFLEAWRRRDDVAVVDASVLPWLLATANNLQRNRTRSGHRGRRALERMRAGAELTSPDHADGVADRVDAEHRAAAVRRAFARLDPLAQDVLTLCVLEGHPLSTAADLLGCPVGTVKSRLSRARTRLRRVLDDAGEPHAVVTPLRAADAAPAEAAAPRSRPLHSTSPHAPSLHAPSERTAS